MANDFKSWLKKEHHPLTQVDDEQHRITMWYEAWANDENMEELLSLSYWEMNAIWEGINLFIEFTKARMDKASNSGHNDLRPLGRVMESSVMAKRKISSVRRYMASKHQHDDLKNEVIATALGDNIESITGEDKGTPKRT